jgi:hypothetical protein
MTQVASGKTPKSFGEGFGGAEQNRPSDAVAWSDDREQEVGLARHDPTSWTESSRARSARQARALMIARPGVPPRLRARLCVATSVEVADGPHGADVQPSLKSAFPAFTLFDGQDVTQPGSVYFMAAARDEPRSRVLHVNSRRAGANVMVVLASCLALRGEHRRRRRRGAWRAEACYCRDLLVARMTPQVAGSLSSLRCNPLSAIGEGRRGSNGERSNPGSSRRKLRATGNP